MNPSEKFIRMLEIGKQGNYMRVTTIYNEIFLCEILDMADEVNDDDEDEPSWDIHIMNGSAKYFTLPCAYVKKIKEVPWQKIGKPNFVYRSAYPNYAQETPEIPTSKGIMYSCLTGDIDPQALVDNYHGTGIPVPNLRDKSPREFIHAQRIIGWYWDWMDEKIIDTPWFKLVYTPKGTYVYPVRPLEK